MRLDPGPEYRDVARHSFLKQEFGRLDDRFCVKAGAHRTVQKRIGDRDHAHALVMRHVSANDGDVGAFG